MECARNLPCRRLSAQDSHGDLPKTGNKNSRPRETKGSKATEAPLDIPPDNPLGRKLRFWGDSPQIKGKKKQKMIKYCCFTWPKNPIRRPSVFWSKFGSDEDWVCQTRVIYVNESFSSTQEENDYALCWLQGLQGKNLGPLIMLTPSLYSTDWGAGGAEGDQGARRDRD